MKKNIKTKLKTIEIREAHWGNLDFLCENQIKFKFASQENGIISCTSWHLIKKIIRWDSVGRITDYSAHVVCDGFQDTFSHDHFYQNPIYYFRA